MNGRGELEEIFQLIEDSQGCEVLDYSRLYGGSINSVYLLRTTKGNKVLKVNTAADFPRMFEAESAGLDTLRAKSRFRIPEAPYFGTSKSLSFLLLEYIEEGPVTAGFWSRFAENLAELHRNSAIQFGFTSSNYIGSLPQENSPTGSASEFYISQRLEPQFKLARERGFQFSGLDLSLSLIAAEIPPEPPALLHGDLWNGNFLITDQGIPCLIDPAVSYGSREMDLAMMRLFGGFPEEVYELYNELFPLAKGYQDRVSLWQLYYLLVHLNIFGSAYLPQVRNILKRYT